MYSCSKIQFQTRQGTFKALWTELPSGTKGDYPDHQLSGNEDKWLDECHEPRSWGISISVLFGTNVQNRRIYFTKAEGDFSWTGAVSRGP